MSRLAFARFTWGVLVYNLGVVLWGAYVRATGSGAGCGSHWPLCNGEVVPRAPSVETMIEYSHRVTSGIALLLVVALPFLARRVVPPGHRLRKVAWVTLVLMLLEAGIGAGLVLFELVADNASAARAMFMATHLMNTFFLLAAITLTAWWAGGGAAPVRPFDRRIARLAGISIAATILIGISGAVAALGDTLFPATSLGDALRQDLSASSHVLIQLRVLHPFLAVGGGFLLLMLVSAVRKTKPSATTRRWANRLNLLVLIQLAAGGINVLLLAPVWMQLVHLLLADLLWLSLILTVVCALAEPARERTTTETSARLAPAAGRRPVSAASRTSHS
ncbi:MAG: COX15/CtaA family protein [Acidobacteriota bacterium]